MNIGIGSKIIWVPGTLDTSEGLREGTVTKTGKENLVWVDNQHKPEDCIWAVYCWPVGFKEELVTILRHRQELKKAFDDSMSEIYQLRNKVQLS